MNRVQRPWGMNTARRFCVHAGKLYLCSENIPNTNVRGAQCGLGFDSFIMIIFYTVCKSLLKSQCKQCKHASFSSSSWWHNYPGNFTWKTINILTSTLIGILLSQQWQDRHSIFPLSTLGDGSMLLVRDLSEWMRHYIKDEPENKTHPAVALILQHLRSEARTFDVVGPAGQNEILVRRQRAMERWQNIRFTIHQSKCKLHQRRPNNSIAL